jgi:hypothetical protein
MMKKNELVVCADGFTMSVQAHEGSYCSPRKNGADFYTEAEVGFPTQQESLLMEWAENPDRPTQTVYGWVPRQVIINVIAKHGGMVTGELPAGFPLLMVKQL